MADVGEVMSRLALEVLEQTLFSQGLGREPSAFQRAVSSYFETIGRIDPLDLLGAPAFVPRLRRRRGRSALEFFDSAVDAIIEKRRALLSGGGEAPRDLLTLLLSAKDPEDGRGIADADVRANIVTFINAGHETTANALTWSLFLLSQSPEWRERAEADADQAFDVDGTVALERCEILRAVFEEALRLYPPAAMLARQAIADDELAGLRIPAGTVVTVSPYVLHRRRGLWDILTPSILPDSLANGAIASTVSPTFHSARGRACASAWPSRCRRGSFCSRIFCALFASTWSRAMSSCRCKG